jgi:hypothetical protein
MTAVKVEIVRFVDEHQPGFVEVALVDAAGRLHTFIEKAPVVTEENLWSDSKYPCSGVIPCRVIGDAGHERVRISTDQPCGVESVEGEIHFVVARSKLCFAG